MAHYRCLQQRRLARAESPCFGFFVCVCVFVWFFINNVRNWNSGGIIPGFLLWRLLALGRCQLLTHVWRRSPPQPRHTPCSGDQAVITTTLTATLLPPWPAPRQPVAIFLPGPPGACLSLSPSQHRQKTNAHLLCSADVA